MGKQIAWYTRLTPTHHTNNYLLYGFQTKPIAPTTTIVIPRAAKRHDDSY